MSREDLRDKALDVGLLLLRLGAGSMLLLGHGLPKIHRLLEGGGFADPIGLGQTASLVLATFAEAACSVLVMAGVLTRASAVPVVFTMLVAALVVHADDPWTKKELAMIYCLPFLVLILTGPGRLSVDRWIFRKRARGA